LLADVVLQPSGRAPLPCRNPRAWPIVSAKLLLLMAASRDFGCSAPHQDGCASGRRNDRGECGTERRSERLRRVDLETPSFPTLPRRRAGSSARRASRRATISRCRPSSIEPALVNDPSGDVVGRHEAAHAASRSLRQCPNHCWACRDSLELADLRVVLGHTVPGLGDRLVRPLVGPAGRSGWGRSAVEGPAACPIVDPSERVVSGS